MTHKEHIFMDHHATTPVDVRVVDRMLPFFSDVFGNPASRNPSGYEALKAVDTARDQTAALIGTDARSIVFTGGATESINIALRGVAAFYKSKGGHIITPATEHTAALETCRYLETQGFTVTYLPVNPQGLIDLNELRETITGRTILISVMYANNEIGTIQDIPAIGEIAREHGVLFHCDASQAAGLEPIDVESMNIDLLSMTAHKFYGPKGVGALYLSRKRPRVRLESILFGGGQENGIRPGTLNVPGVVGMGAACDIALQERVDLRNHVLRLRTRLQEQLFRRLPDARLNGHPHRRHPGNLNVTLLSINAFELLDMLPNLSISTGSACASAIPRPSHVLSALGLSDRLARGTFRFGLGRQNTEHQVDEVIGEFCQVVNKLRASK